MIRFKPLFEDICQGRSRVLVYVVISSIVLPVLVNLLFLSDHFKGVMADRTRFISIGLVIYGGWIALLWWFFKKDTLRLSDLSLTIDKIKAGVIAGLLVYIIASVIVIASLLLNKKELVLVERFSSVPMVLDTLFVFIFNILIGAFIEEVVCRAYLIPQVFLKIRRKINNATVSFIITILITQALFAAIHIPRDLFRLGMDFQQLMFNAEWLFMSGLIATALFLLTRNVIFVTFFHAYFNMSLLVVESTLSFNFIIHLTAFALALFARRLFFPRAGQEGVLRGELP